MIEPLVLVAAAAIVFVVGVSKILVVGLIMIDGMILLLIRAVAKLMPCKLRREYCGGYSQIGPEESRGRPPWEQSG